MVIWMGFRAIVMNQKQLNELSALRRQKREWELQRATLVAEQAYLETKVKDLGVAFVKQCDKWFPLAFIVAWFLIVLLLALT